MSLGASLLSRNDFRRCIDCFESAAKFDAAPMGALNNLGLALYKKAVEHNSKKKPSLKVENVSWGFDLMT